MKLKSIRKSQNLNAMELAQKAGLDLNQPLMSAMESGKVLPTPHDLQAVCEALHCTPIDLFDSVDEFDLMAVERRMNGVDKVPMNELDKLPQLSRPPFDKPNKVPFKYMKLRMFHTANPKRGFRMSDTKWNRLQAVIKWLGYNSLGAYLNALSDELPEKRA